MRAGELVSAWVGDGVTRATAKRPALIDAFPRIRFVDRGAVIRFACDDTTYSEVAKRWQVTEVDSANTASK